MSFDEQIALSFDSHLKQIEETDGKQDGDVVRLIVHAYFQAAHDTALALNNRQAAKRLVLYRDALLDNIAAKLAAE